MVSIYSYLVGALRCSAPFCVQRAEYSDEPAIRTNTPFDAARTTERAVPAGVHRSAAGLCLVVLLCLPGPLLHAQNYDAEFNQWFAVQTNTENWSADFTQTRSLVALSEPLKSSGKVWVEPGEFRWELGQPPLTIVVRTPNELLILYPRFKRAEVYALDKIPPGPIKDAMALLDVSLPRDRAAMERQFQLLSATVTNSILQMKLEPKSVSARQFVGAIVIGFHTNDFKIAESEMQFSDGSILRNDFNNVVFNQEIDPKLFATNIPPDYSIVEPLNR